MFESWKSDFDNVNQEELIEILDKHSCRKILKASTCNTIIHELAHKRLVQEPAYVIEQWAKVLRQDLATDGEKGC